MSSKDTPKKVPAAPGTSHAAEPSPSWSIHWSTGPYVAHPSGGWYDWDLSGVGEVSRPGDRGIEVDLGWPEGTIALLRQAFDQGLDRHQGWRLQHDAQTDQGASLLTKAAAVFRRGVPCSPLGLTKPSIPPILPSPTSGSYLMSMARAAPHFTAADFGLVDAAVHSLWRDRVSMSGLEPVRTDESSKSLATVAQILRLWRQRGQPSPWHVVGGGLLADMAGFAAALVGVPVYFYPTTLLAMIDACVGGKTGVNFSPYGKNQVGAFYFPAGVDVWPGWLETLPPEDLKAGGMEGLKHAFLMGDLHLAEQLSTALSTGSWQALPPLLPPLIRYKAEVITRDPTERGERAILNFGHTLGHALEGHALEGHALEAHARESCSLESPSTAQETLLHGEAVGCGMVFALLLSQEVSGLAPGHTQEMIGLIQQSGGLLSRTQLGQRLGVVSLEAAPVWERLLSYMGFDKKNERGRPPQWVLLKAPGEVDRDGERWVRPVATQRLPAIWRAFLAALNP